MVYLVIILIFSFLGMGALFHPGLFTAHDITHQVVRLYYYSQAVNDGQLPPYWTNQLANGFGYPLFLFSYHLPWLIGVPLLKLGFSIPNAIKTLFFLSYFFSGITMYFFVNNLLKNKLSALLSSIIYLWLPYHFLIILVGASMGISFIFVFLPLIFLGIHQIGKKSKLGETILALGISGVILSHIMHAVFLLPSILFFLIWELTIIRQKFQFLKNTIFGLILGILISSFYLVPATYYKQFTRAQQEGGFYELYKRNFINFGQLIYAKWGYGPIINNAKNGESSFQLGFGQWIATITLIVLIVLRKIKKIDRTLSLFLLGAFVFNIFLMLDFSKFVWDTIIKLVVVDYPFRLLLPATFIASVCAGIILVNIRGNLRILVFIFFTLVAIYTNRNHINANQYTNLSISSYLDLETEKTTNTFHEYLPLRANPKLLDKPWNEILGNNLSASNLRQTTNLLYFDLEVFKETTVSIGQFYFPGQTLYLDNKITNFDVDKEGRITLVIPTGNHSLAIKYQETPLIRFSKYLTLASIVWLFMKKVRF